MESFLDLGCEMDFEQLEKSKQNTKTIFSSFIVYEMGYDDDEIDSAIFSYLNKSIKILESKEPFSKKQLIGSLLNIEPDYWNDLFTLNLYNEKFKELQSGLPDLENSFNSEVDHWAKDKLRTQLIRTKANINNLQRNIELSTTFRRLMLVEISDLEIQFKQKFDEYNKQQKQIELEIIDKTEIETKVNVKHEVYTKETFKDLPDSGLPVINKDIINPDFVFEKYHNNGIKCSQFAFYAWLVYGKKYEKEKLEWTFEIKAQLKVFIDKITGTVRAKESYFNQVFGIPLTKSDYKHSNTLDKHFILLSNEIDKNKLKINKQGTK